MLSNVNVLWKLEIHIVSVELFMLLELAGSPK